MPRLKASWVKASAIITVIQTKNAIATWFLVEIKKTYQVGYICNINDIIHHEVVESSRCGHNNLNSTLALEKIELHVY